MTNHERLYRIADMTVGITFHHTFTPKMCQEYEIEMMEEPQIRIHVTQAEIERERGCTEGAFSDAYLESLAVYRKLCEAALTYDTFLFHGSAVAVDGKAYLFTAPSGTGKSTHVKLWREYFGERAVVVNDDKPLIQVKENEIYVCGTPWSGKHYLNTNVKVPLHGVCALNRGTENKIEEMSPIEGYPVVYRQAYRPQDKASMMKTLGLLKQLVERVPMYQLHCNISQEAVEVAWGKMHLK